MTDFSVQEIDLLTHNLVFFWDALEHIPLADSYQPISYTSSAGADWDPYHLNSISLTDNPNDILVSGRNTWTVYRINKLTGHIEWELGGKQSDFTIESSAQFSWQHDVVFIESNVISMFDDDCCRNSSVVPPDTPYSHGMILNLNFGKMTAAMDKTYYHTPNLNVSSQGDLQILNNGNIFIGWGQEPYFSEFAYGGNESDNTTQNLLYDAIMPGNNMSYRTYRYSWVGQPSYPPSLAVKQSANGQPTAYVSWNGSTETTRWIVLSGSSPANLSFAESAVKSGFETAIQVSGADKYYAAQAIDAHGNILGVSNVVSVAN